VTAVERVAVLERVTYSYPDRPRPALRDVSLTLHPAEVVLLVGGSGSGKSTLLRALNGLVPHFHGGTFAGRVLVAGMDTRSTPPRELAAHVGLVFQEPENQAVMATVEHEIAFGLENLGLAHGAINRLVEEALISLGLSRLRHAELATLSGGELQKVALAAVLSMQPHLLLLDEPTSQLDPVSSEELLAAVRRLSEDTGATIVLAEHRVERCLHLATRVLYMESGAVTIDAEPQEFARWAVAHRRELLPPVARLFAARTDDHPEADGEAFVDVASGLPLTVKDARRLLAGGDLGTLAAVRGPQLRGSPGPAAAVSSPSGPDEAASQPSAGGSDGAAPQSIPRPPAVEVRGLVAGYPPDEPILDGLDLTLAADDLVAVMGENGSGKSTLVRHFNGLQRPLAGTVRLHGREVASLSVAEAARGCAYLGQNPGAYFVKESVAAELEYALAVLEVDPAERAGLIERTVAEMDLGDLMDRDPRDLSGGERTRVALAAVTCAEPGVLVLDEPTRGMDPTHKAALFTLVRRWAAAGRCVVVVTHDVEFAARIAERVLVLGDGGVLADGPVHEVLHGSLFFSTQIDRLLRHRLPGVLTEEEVVWVERTT
jgi:energy-coupling factor transport system ATP-binding protein